jgi:hypothetical protein
MIDGIPKSGSCWWKLKEENKRNKEERLVKVTHDEAETLTGHSEKVSAQPEKMKKRGGRGSLAAALLLG